MADAPATGTDDDGGRSVVGDTSSDTNSIPTTQPEAPSHPRHHAAIVRQGTTRLFKSVRRVIDDRRMSPVAVRTAFRSRLSSARLFATVLHFHANNIAEKEIRAVLVVLKMPVLLVLVCINFFSGLYLLLWSLLLFSMDDAVSIQYVVKRKLSAIVFFAMSILHFHELATLCGHDRRRHHANKSRTATTKSTPITAYNDAGVRSRRTQGLLESAAHSISRFLPFDAVVLCIAKSWQWTQRFLAIPAHWRKKFVHWLHKYEVLHMARHVLVAVTTSIHAHHMSLVIPEPSTSFFYAAIVALNCLFTPVLLASKNAFIKKYLTLLLDAVFHFVLSVGFPLVVFWPTYLHYMRSPSTALVNTTYESIAQNLLIDHLQTFNTVLDCVTAIVLHVSNHLSVHYLAKMALTTDKHQHRRVSTAMSTPSTTGHPPSKTSPVARPLDPHESTGATATAWQVRPASGTTQGMPPAAPFNDAAFPFKRPRLSLLSRWVAMLQRRQNRVTQAPVTSLDPFALPHHRSKHLLRGLFILGSWAWAVTLLVGASSAFFYTECPVGCRHRVSEWFHYECSCRDFTLTCTPSMTMTDVAARLTNVDANLFLLNVVQCDLPHGLPPGLIRRFQGLYLLSLDSINLATWDEPPTEVPSSLQFLQIRHGRFRQTPRIFESLPRSLIAVSIEATPLDTVPPGWSSLVQLQVWGGNLSTFPSHLTAAVALSLFNNSIRDFPSTLPPQLEFLDLRYNDVTALPPTLFTPPTELVLVDMSYNPLETIPEALVPFVFNLTLVVAGTSFCHDLVARNQSTLELPHDARAEEICFVTCAPGCEPDILGDSYCDLACNNAACGFDEGDCVSVP